MHTHSFAPAAWLLAAILPAGAASAHEAWLIEPDEIAHLEHAPLPELFTDPLAIGIAVLTAAAVAAAALRTERAVAALEARVFAPFVQFAPVIGPLVLRVGLAVMLLLAAAGGLPRHGTALWAEPTLFVPDMQLSLAPGWAGLASIEVAVALLLLAGFLTRMVGLGLVGLSALGLVAFGLPFLDYALHFAVPGLMLAILGGGALSLDRMAGTDGLIVPQERLAGLGWSAALGLTGGGFVYLGVTCKVAEPTLLVALLEEGGVPLFGVPVAVAAMIMAGVEITAGLLLGFGRLVRPIAMFLIGAFTFFAVVLGENPLFHANLYGIMVMFLLAGRELSQATALASQPRPA